MTIHRYPTFALIEINTDDDCYWNGEFAVRIKVVGVDEEEIFQKMKDYFSKVDICVLHDEHKALEMRGYVNEAIAAIEAGEYEFERGGNRTVEYVFFNRDYDYII